jgi:hypothetical protein
MAECWDFSELPVTCGLVRSLAETNALKPTQGFPALLLISRQKELTLNQRVPGSSPGAPANAINHLANI